MGSRKERQEDAKNAKVKSLRTLRSNPWNLCVKQNPDKVRTFPGRMPSRAKASAHIFV